MFQCKCSECGYEFECSIQTDICADCQDDLDAALEEDEDE